MCGLLAAKTLLALALGLQGCGATPAASSALTPLEVCSIGGGSGALCAGGLPVILRGSNYIRLNNGHSTFAPESYNRTRYIQAFAQMQHDGYNVVRVFVDGKRVGGASSSMVPFDAMYISRMVEFLRDAARHGLYTIVTLEWLPGNAYFRSFTAGVPPMGGGMNNFFLQKEFHEAWEAYASQLAQSLKQGLSEDAQNGVILSLQNELFMQSDVLPFSDSSKSITCADGKTYAMSNATQRQQAMDNNVNLWADQARKAWKAVLAQSLVTVGVFSFQAVHKPGPNGLMCSTSDCRFPARPYWLSRSELDFLDVHIYQKDGSQQSLQSNLQSMEWSGLNKRKPIVMGEFGCLGGLRGGGWYSSAQQCAPHVKDLQVSSCSHGFSGWLFWTWDTDTPNEQPEWFSMVDEKGAINGILAPIANPDACAKLVAVV